MTFGLYGDLLQRFVTSRRGFFAVDASGRGPQVDRAFLLWTLRALLGVAVDDAAVECAAASQSSPHSSATTPVPSARPSCAVVHAGALGLALQLASLWSRWLQLEELSVILDFAIAVSKECVPVNLSVRLLLLQLELTLTLDDAV